MRWDGGDVRRSLRSRSLVPRARGLKAAVPSFAFLRRTLTRPVLATLHSGETLRPPPVRRSTAGALAAEGFRNLSAAGQR
jgi:hypothetical protein